MSAYEQMIRTNEELICHSKISETRKQEIVTALLSEASMEQVDGPAEYPRFYLPRDTKTRFRTLMMQLPKTLILSANSYELEILRLLIVLSPDNPKARNMVDVTVNRLRQTCFGNTDDGVGECFDTSLIVLRFLATAVPHELQWMKERIENFHRHYAEKPRHAGILWYYWLCLSELPIELARPEIMYFKEILLQRITQSYIMKSEQNKEFYPMCICIVRNCLARLEEFEFIKEFQPYVNKNDGRLHFSLIG